MGVSKNAGFACHCFHRGGCGGRERRRPTVLAHIKADRLLYEMLLKTQRPIASELRAAWLWGLRPLIPSQDNQSQVTPSILPPKEVDEYEPEHSVQDEHDLRHSPGIEEEQSIPPTTRVDSQIFDSDDDEFDDVFADHQYIELAVRDEQNDSPSDDSNEALTHSQQVPHGRITLQELCSQNEFAPGSPRPLTTHGPALKEFTSVQRYSIRLFDAWSAGKSGIKDYSLFREVFQGMLDEMQPPASSGPWQTLSLMVI